MCNAGEGGEKAGYNNELLHFPLPSSKPVRPQDISLPLLLASSLLSVYFESSFNVLQATPSGVTVTQFSGHDRLVRIIPIASIKSLFVGKYC